MQTRITALGVIALAAWAKGSGNFVRPQAAAPPESVRFRFAPADGTRFTCTLKTLRKKSSGGRSQIDRGTTVAKVEIKKREGGYDVIETITSVEMERDGAPAPDIISKAFIGVSVTSVIDESGQLTDIQGLAAVLSGLQQSLSAKAAQALGELISEEALIQKNKAEWRGRIGDSVGKTARVGEVWKGQSDYALPTGGSITYNTATRFVGWEKVSGRQCLRIRYAYTSDATALGGFLREKMDALYKRLEMENPGFDLQKANMRGAGERLIDPQTMLIYWEINKRVIRLPMRVASQNLPVTVVEQRDYRYEYE